MIDAARLRGIHPILYAFFDAEGRARREPIAAQVEAAVRHRAHGVAVLGLATETNKLDVRERRQILDWTAEALRGRLPLAVTISEPSINGQIEFVRAAKGVGADWAILQPPPIAGFGESEYLRFFGAVAEKSELPLAVQNAAQFLSVGLSNAGLVALNRNHPNVCLIKGEAPAHVIERLVAETAGAYRVFNGRGGLELTDTLRAGCVGVIPAPECFDVQVKIFELMAQGRADAEATANELYRDIAPLVSFMMSSLDTFLCYGKRIVARRLGLGDVIDRAPCLHPTPFGLAMMERFLSRLPPL
jgi:4-hydroxy-tetrahydrodipicolinate synthase